MHPSLDVKSPTTNGKHHPTNFNGNGNGSQQLSKENGVDYVIDQLDDLNARYQKLCDILYKRLKEIAERCPGDIVTLVSPNLCYLIGY